MSIGQIVPGSVVSVSVGFLTHPGIWTGQGTVIACSFDHGKVVELSIGDFANGKGLTAVGYPGPRNPNAVVDAARREIGKPWSLLTNNCEHFVHRAHGLPPRSPQLENAAIIFLTVAAVWCFSRMSQR